MCPTDKSLNKTLNQEISPFSRRFSDKTEPVGAATSSNKLRKLCLLPKRLTYAALLDGSQHETEITDFMVRRACDEMDCMQQFPFAPR